MLWSQVKETVRLSPSTPPIQENNMVKRCDGYCVNSSLETCAEFGCRAQSETEGKQIVCIDSVRAQKALAAVEELKEYMASARDWNEGWEEVRLTFKKYGFVS
jgi:hypothetical protein